MKADPICGIYKIQSISNPDRVYIGSAASIVKRWYRHRIDLKAKKHHSPKLQRHYDKYGREDLVFSILQVCDRDSLLQKEQCYMNIYKPYFNISKVAGRAASLVPWNKGKKMPNEVWNKGKKMPESYIITRMGHSVSLETREKIRQSLKGRKQPLEDVRKRALSNLNPVLQFDKNYNLLNRYESVVEVVDYGFIYQHVSACCRGKRKSSGGYYWKYESR